MKNKTSMKSQKTKLNKQGIAMKRLDEITMNMNQPRGWGDVIAKSLCITVGGAAVAGLMYVGLKAIDAELTSVVEHRDSERLAQGQNEFGGTYQTRVILSEADKDRLYKPLFKLPGKDEDLA